MQGSPIAEFAGCTSVGALSPARRILMMPLGTLGDVIPFVRLGRELQRRGHAVTIIACNVFEPYVRRAGIEFESLLGHDEYEAVVANPWLWHPRWAGITFLREAVLPFMHRQFDVADNAIRSGGCDVLVSPAQSLGARIAQEKFGVPLVTVHLAPYMFRSAIASRRVSGVSLPDWFPPSWRRAFFRIADFCGDVSFGREVNAFRAELGLPRVRRVFWKWWNSPERIVALFPEWFAEPQADWPPQTVLAGFLPVEEEEETPLDAGLERFLRRGSPPIVFTAGTAMAHGEQFFEESLRAAQLLGERVILLSQFGGQFPDELPPSVIAREFVPLARLLRRVAVIVHHGGVGTTVQALAAGVPQLVVPMSFDQPDNAHRVEQAGVGRVMRRQRYRANDVATSLRGLIDDRRVASRCVAVAEECKASDGVRVACDEIEALSWGRGAATDVKALRTLVRPR